VVGSIGPSNALDGQNFDSEYVVSHLFCTSVVGRLDMVPYIHTFVQYDGTFGASDQGQTLDV
jgi:hypothetical protein